MSLLANINANPCKMCLPLGTVTAFYGIKRCMNILHGSQGCSTYIRRHMATHYNEPIDIACSSLTEEGTVFGGEANLIKGLDNLTRLYNPEIIAVSTTCLAETIGEDVPAIISRYQRTHPQSRVKIVSVPSAGYSGTQYEGWFRALRALIDQISMKPLSHGSINVICGPISPADTRALKKLMDLSKLNYVLLPDISRNLDAPFMKVYNRLPQNGTTLSDIASMAGAKVTLELAVFCPPEESPGTLLEERYGVPVVKLNPPIGLRDTDAFIKILKYLGAKFETVTEERGRLIDAMIDSHKYSALGRAAIFGDPDLVYGLTRLCTENGLVPVVAATGSKASGFEKLVSAETSQAAANLMIERFSVLNYSDFLEIESACVDNNVNLLVGNSDGRRLSEKYGWPLVRCAFPIHDHVGGQRIRTFGYSGSLITLDRLVNCLCSRVEENFRSDLKLHYLDQGRKKIAVSDPTTNENKTKTHPCFTVEAVPNCARIHLAVAPKCNISCNYCNRNFDCPNEARPGVTSSVLSPKEALEHFIRVKKDRPELTVAGIAGPGEALANFEEVAETIELIRNFDPDITFCLSTNGLMLPKYIGDLCDLGLTHLTITINTLDPMVGAKIYRQITYFGQSYEGQAAAALILAGQLTGLQMAVEKGLAVKVNTVLLKGLNETSLEDIAKKVASLGAKLHNIMQLLPIPGTPFENLATFPNIAHQDIRKKCSTYIPQMHHCQQCRADAIGFIDSDTSILYRTGNQKSPKTDERLELGLQSQKRIAVVSKSGVIVDQHFRQAERFYIYESDGKDIHLIENRKVLDDNNGDCQKKASRKKPEGYINKLIESLTDCDGLVVMRIGESPKKALTEKGIKVISTYETVDKAVRTAAMSLEPASPALTHEAP